MTLKKFNQQVERLRAACRKAGHEASDTWINPGNESTEIGIYRCSCGTYAWRRLDSYTGKIIQSVISTCTREPKRKARKR